MTTTTTTPKAKRTTKPKVAQPVIPSAEEMVAKYHEWRATATKVAALEKELKAYAKEHGALRVSPSKQWGPTTSETVKIAANVTDFEATFRRLMDNDDAVAVALSLSVTLGNLAAGVSLAAKVSGRDASTMYSGIIDELIALDYASKVETVSFAERNVSV
jgi:hypothetical protein